MARLRKGVSYRRLERPYTRKSKYKSKMFVRATPHSNIIRFVMGNPKAAFDTTLNLMSKNALQIRHNAIESARQTSNRVLEKKLGKDNYHYVIRIYPHHILRENPLASGAGADRMSTGMQKAFGKPIGVAAQVRENQVLATININKSNIAVARDALRRAASKMPCSTRVDVISAKQ